jgi:hypothetical protein
MRRKLRRSSHNSSPVLRRVFRTLVSQLEDRTLLATVTWAGDVRGDWDDAAMWTGGAIPGPADDAVIPFSDITVTHSSSTIPVTATSSLATAPPAP